LAANGAPALKKNAATHGMRAGCELAAPTDDGPEKAATPPVLSIRRREARNGGPPRSGPDGEERDGRCAKVEWGEDGDDEANGGNGSAGRREPARRGRA
jgi:hypothetical protein